MVLFLDVDVELLQNEAFLIEDLDHQSAMVLQLGSPCQKDYSIHDNKLEPSWQVLVNQLLVVNFEERLDRAYHAAHPALRLVVGLLLYDEFFGLHSPHIFSRDF